MTDRAIDESLMDQFSCPVCFNYMGQKIYICSNGHSLCGTCSKKLSKCPICKVKLNLIRNIVLEKIAKKAKELNVNGEIMPMNMLSLKRRQRFSLGSPAAKLPLEGDIFMETQIQCPHIKCCYFTKHLLQLKIHLQTWHPKQLYAIKKDPTVKSEKQMRVRLYWELSSVHNMFIITISEAFFLVYIVRTPTYLKNSSHYVNVLTISNETEMYKFSCGTFTKFSKFYQGRHQAQEGIEVDSGIVETVRRGGTAMYFIQILITRVASLHDEKQE